MDGFNESFESVPNLLLLPEQPVSSKTDNPIIRIEGKIFFIVNSLKIIANLSIIGEITFMEQKND